MEEMKVLESGNTIDDVIEFVRMEMFKLYLKEEEWKNRVIILNGNDSDNDSNNKDAKDKYL